MSDKNPFTRLWNFLGVLGGILSLSSMVDDWFSDVSKWRGFIASIIESYRGIREPIVLALVPFDVPGWFQDYLVFGAVVAAAFTNSVVKELMNRWPLRSTLVGWRRRWWDFNTRAGFAMFVVVFWPYYLALHCIPPFVWDRLDKGADENERIALRARLTQFWSWLAAIALGVCLLLAVNANLRGAP